MLSPILDAVNKYFRVGKWRLQTTDHWRDMLQRCWFLGLTSFGGPAVHFQIFRRQFVEKHKWIDDQMYQEIFALCQALPGPGSTKMLYGINVIHGGFLTGVAAFLLWSLPMAFASFGLGLGVAQIEDRLPDPVYALLSGLNSATVGIIILAAVQLSEKAITDQVSRVIVFFGAAAGLLYNTLWYFPVLMVVGGLSTIIWDSRRLQNFARQKFFRRNRATVAADDEAHSPPIELRESQPVDQQPGRQASLSSDQDRSVHQERSQLSEDSNERAVPEAVQMKVLSWKLGVAIIVAFFITFIAVMVLRAVLPNRPRGFSLFANLYLAGTIIFGGGPVVIPLLREYIVAEGWVTPRDFLLGLAIIQSFPGPNFNFAVYLGTLAAKGTSLPMIGGAMIGYVAIFAPGMILHTGIMGIWSKLRGYRWLLSCLRGVNAAAVGLIYTAVYRLWKIGYLDGQNQQGASLESDPWFVVVTATAFVGGRWFKLEAPVAILLGGVMGMVWYGIVRN